MVQEIALLLGTMFGISNESDEYIKKEADWLLGMIERRGMTCELPYNSIVKNIIEDGVHATTQGWEQEDDN